MVVRDVWRAFTWNARVRWRVRMQERWICFVSYASHCVEKRHSPLRLQCGTWRCSGGHGACLGWSQSSRVVEWSVRCISVVSRVLAAIVSSSIVQVYMAFSVPVQDQGASPGVSQPGSRRCTACTIFSMSQHSIPCCSGLWWLGAARPCPA